VCRAGSLNWSSRSETLPSYAISHLHASKSTSSRDDRQGDPLDGHKLVNRRVRRRRPVLPLVDLSDRRRHALRVEWPAADVIIGNPPFHGSQHLRQALVMITSSGSREPLSAVSRTTACTGSVGQPTTSPQMAEPDLSAPTPSRRTRPEWRIGLRSWARWCYHGRCVHRKVARRCEGPRLTRELVQRPTILRRSSS